MTVPETSLAPGAFPSTAWSIVAGSREQDAARRRQALERLAAAYWKPVFTHIRFAWRKQVEEARDLTQDFFACVVLESGLLDRYEPRRGRFRSFLKAALTNFLRDSAKHASRAKRGGGVAPLPFGDLGDVPASSSRTPEAIFDDAWRAVVIERALALAEGRLPPVALEVFRRYDLTAARDVSYESIARDLAIEPAAVKRHLERAREEFRRAVVQTVAETIDGDDDLTEELRELLAP